MFHAIDSTTLPDVITGADTGGNFGVEMSFKLSDLPFYTEFTTLYDEYRIRGVVVEMVPTFTNVSMATTSAGAIGQSSVYSALDFNGDFGSVYDLATIGQRNGCRRTNGNRVHRRYFHPRPLTQLAGDAAFSSNAYTSRASGWISCANTSVPHFGLNLLVEQFASTGTFWLFRFTYTYYVEFRATK